ncbi:hypothetical protein Ddc_16970 [Ditylenchus destructor]|nr:hypothetical protein Ddc_16970 [Ditylenchus destructor]
MHFYLLPDPALLADRKYAFLLAFFCFLTLNTLLCQGNDLRVKGPQSVVVQVKSDLTDDHNAPIQTITPLSLWCQAINTRNMEVVPMLESVFRHNGVLYPSQLQPDGKNATFTKDIVTQNDAGVWTCSVSTRAHGNATGNINVNLRPVILDNSSRIYASGATIVRGFRNFILLLLQFGILMLLPAFRSI